MPVAPPQMRRRARVSGRDELLRALLTRRVPQGARGREPENAVTFYFPSPRAPAPMASLASRCASLNGEFRERVEHIIELLADMRDDAPRAQGAEELRKRGAAPALGAQQSQSLGRLRDSTTSLFRELLDFLREGAQASPEQLAEAARVSDTGEGAASLELCAESVERVETCLRDVVAPLYRRISQESELWGTLSSPGMQPKRQRLLLLVLRASRKALARAENTPPQFSRAISTRAPAADRLASSFRKMTC